MSYFISVLGRRFCFRVGCAAAVASACLLLTGCNNLDLRDGGFGDSQTFDLLGPSRPTDGEREFFGVSNKAREIERNCMR